MTILFLLLPISVFAIFWLFALKRKWRYIRLMALTMSLCLEAAALILWTSTTIQEGWILGIGSTFAILVGLIILSLPFTAPEIVERLDFKW